MRELTPHEITRQDFVDNYIHTMLHVLTPMGFNCPIPWDIELIGDIRSVIQDRLRVKLNIAGHIDAQQFPEAHDAERRRYEQAFYPSID